MIVVVGYGWALERRLVRQEGGGRRRRVRGSGVFGSNISSFGAGKKLN